MEETRSAASHGVDGDDAQGDKQNNATMKAQRTPEAISSLRSAIDAKLHEQGIYDEIRELVHRKAQALRQTNTSPKAGINAVHADDAGITSGPAASDEARLIQDVLGSEVVQQLLTMVRSTTIKKDAAHPDGGNDGAETEDVEVANENDVYLYLRLAGGRAFVDQLLTDEAESDRIVGGITDAQVGQVQTFFRVSVMFQTQRQTANDVMCCVDPPFNDCFRFRIDKRKTRTQRTKTRGAPYEVEVVSAWEALCLVDEPVQIDVLKVVKRFVQWNSSAQGSGPQWHEVSRELLAVHRLDWRRVLCSTLQLVHLPVSLVGKMKVPIGTLDLRADLLHFKRTSSVARDVSALLNKETLQRNTLNHSFYQYAKHWWEEYRSEAAIYDDSGKRDHDHDEYRKMTAHPRPRLVKLFAEDDDGRFRMVCKFVTPLRVPIAIRSPSEATRFVGLLPYESTPVVGGTRDDTWRSISAFLSVGKGDAQDHALLLASLLLGCGLDAYVCIGTIAADVQKSRLREAKQHPRSDRRGFGSEGAVEIGHVWVLTRGTNPQDPSTIWFWESVTGERYKVLEKGGHQHHGYCAIDCVFSHRQFYANLQPREWRLRDTSFNFEDESVWKPMNEAMIADLPYGQPPIALLPPDLLQLPTREHDWTIALKKQISSRRRANGYITRWSDELSFYLLPALNAYEMERLYGVAQVENELFQQSITRFVQEGHTFQGVPVMFTFESVPEAMETLDSHELVANIIHLHAKASQFGLAVRCFAYPENLVVTWVMLAVSYQSFSA